MCMYRYVCTYRYGGFGFLHSKLLLPHVGKGTQRLPVFTVMLPSPLPGPKGIGRGVSSEETSNRRRATPRGSLPCRRGLTLFLSTQQKGSLRLALYDERGGEGTATATLQRLSQRDCGLML